jgi:hypothetical protein
MSELNDHNPTTRAEQEVAEVLNALLREKPLPPEPKPEKSLRSEGVYRITDPEVRTLNCVAIIRDGEIMPLIDTHELPDVPKTPGGKMHLAMLTIQAITGGVMDALEFWEERRRQREEGRDDDEGGCRV